MKFPRLKPWPRVLAAIAALSMLAAMGCSAVAVGDSSDPGEKLAQAQAMEEVGRLAVARRLILEAAELYQQEGDELGLAEAYRQYGFFVRVNGEDAIMRRSGVSQAEPGPDDVKWMDRSIEYFEKALEIFERREVWDKAANLHYNIGGSHYFAGRLAEACAAFDRSLEVFNLARQQNPQGIPKLPEGVRSYPEFIALAKEEAKCPS